MKRYTPLIVIALVYVAFVLIDLGTGLYKPAHLILFPLATLGFFVPVLFVVHLVVSLFARPWREDELTWLIISIDILIAGILATIEIL